MAEVQNRTQLEADLARKLGKMFNDHRKELLKWLGDPPNTANIPLSFWDDIRQHMKQELMGVMMGIYMNQAEGLMGKMPLGVDWALVNSRAANWASQYVGQLITNITGTTQRAVQNVIDAYFRQGLTLGDVTNYLNTTMPKIFGPARAEMIAITEVTRAAAAGEEEIWQELHGMGVDMVTIWLTSEDELVCPICSYLDGREADGRDGDRPYWNHPDVGAVYLPAHPRCRCAEGNELPEV